MFSFHRAGVFVSARASRFFGAVTLGLLFAALPNAARADSFTVSRTDYSPFYVSAVNLTVRAGETVNFDHIQDMGGDLKGILNGELLQGTYCVNLTDPVYLNSSYNATTVSKDGKVFGESIQNAEKVAYLLKTYSAGATTVDLQNALQAAIWRTEYGSGFQVDGVDNNKSGNTTAMKNAYTMYLQGLGNNTARVSDVLWISPVVAANQTNKPKASTTSHYQGLVAVRASGKVLPEPGAAGLLLTGALPFVGMIARRRKS